jgi:NtrC-family two-component system response regulator AlgB
MGLSFMDTGRPKASLNVLVVDDEPNIRKLLSVSLVTDGHVVTTVNNARDALAESVRKSFDLALVDLRLGADTGLDLVPKLVAQSPWLRVVVITAHASIDTAVEAIRRGASDYLPKPFTPAELGLVIDRVAQVRALEQRVAGLQGALGEADSSIDLDSGSPDMRRAVELGRQVADSDASVCIRGESGTGKGVLARAIHGWSGRGEKPFTTVSCPTLSPQLLEGELFGHARGAFTGALRDNPGRIAASEGGTLFLDEIGDMPLELQPKLLRFVQEREYERVGEALTRRADVRLITATNINLDEAVQSGRFRGDLLYRINVIQIELPPLRERKMDIIPMAQRMLTHFSKGRPIASLSDETRDLLTGYSWPGNVRELRNVIERAVILCRGEQIAPQHLPGNFATKPTEPRLGDPVPVEAIEAVHIRRVVAAAKSMEEAAQALGIDAATLWRKRKKFGI